MGQLNDSIRLRLIFLSVATFFTLIFFFISLITNYRSRMVLRTVRIGAKLALQDIFFVLRTSKTSERRLLPDVMKTWFIVPSTHAYIMANGNISATEELIPSQHHRKQMFATKCSDEHRYLDMCCQTASAFDLFFSKNFDYLWMCQFDENQYVNVFQLQEYLQQFPADRNAFYIGKPKSTRMRTMNSHQFQYGILNAGICYSKKLLTMIRNSIQPTTKFIQECAEAKVSDDVYVAYLLKSKFNVSLTIANEFHHHYEKEWFNKMLNGSMLGQAITIDFKDRFISQLLSLSSTNQSPMTSLYNLLYGSRDVLHDFALVMKDVEAKTNETFKKHSFTT